MSLTQRKPASLRANDPGCSAGEGTLHGNMRSIPRNTSTANFPEIQMVFDSEAQQLTYRRHIGQSAGRA